MRKPTQLRHDYKPPSPEPSRVNRLPWFAAGLGLPLLGLAFGFSTRDERPVDPRELLVQELALPAQPVQIEPPLPIDEPPGTRLDLNIRSGDTLDGLFVKHQLSRADLARMMRVTEAKKNLRLLRPGDTITVYHDDEQVQHLSRRLSETLSLIIKRADEQFVAEFIAHPTQTRTRHGRGRIDSSLFLAAKDAGLSDTLTMKLAGIFAWDIDFVLDIRGGDEFTVVYEEIWQNGEYLRDGEIVAAEFVNQGETFRAVRYADPTGEVAYFTPEGRNVRKAFLRAPIALTPRVTSNFNPRRLHPILKVRRPHRGVDYGASTGTPIKAAGDGKVILRGRNGGYGNCVILQHGGNITTLYAHLSKYARNTRVGNRVKQGQTIGYVGRTGLANAPHLHYEYRVNGVHRNPRTVKLPDAAPVNDKYKEDFARQAESLLSQLDLVKQTRLARAAPAR